MTSQRNSRNKGRGESPLVGEPALKHSYTLEPAGPPKRETMSALGEKWSSDKPDGVRTRGDYRALTGKSGNPPEKQYASPSSLSRVSLVEKQRKPTTKTSRRGSGVVRGPDQPGVIAVYFRTYFSPFYPTSKPSFFYFTRSRHTNPRQDTRNHRIGTKKQA